MQNSAFLCSLSPKGVGSCFCTVSSLICVTTQKCSDVTRKSGKKIIKFILHDSVRSCQVRCWSCLCLVSRELHFKNTFMCQNANTVRSNKLQTGFNLLSRWRIQVKCRAPLWRVHAEICCKNAKVDMNVIQMEMCVSLGTVRNSRAKG